MVDAWRARLGVRLLVLAGWRGVPLQPVPVALACIDYGKREVGVGAYVHLTGDVGADMARFAAFYADKVACHPERAGPFRLPDDFDG